MERWAAAEEIQRHFSSAAVFPVAVAHGDVLQAPALCGAPPPPVLDPPTMVLRHPRARVSQSGP